MVSDFITVFTNFVIFFFFFLLPKLWAFSESPDGQIDIFTLASSSTAATSCSWAHWTQPDCERIWRPGSVEGQYDRKKYQIKAVFLLSLACKTLEPNVTPAQATRGGHRLVPYLACPPASLPLLRLFCLHLNLLSFCHFWIRSSGEQSVSYDRDPCRRTGLRRS